MNADDFIADILEHGESRYDPVKAREYYLRTRQLKGRRSTADLRTKAKKEGWTYVKNQVEQERKQAYTKAAEANRQAMVRLQETAKRRREEIQQKLEAIMNSLDRKDKEGRGKAREAAQAERDRLSSDLKASLDKARTNYKKAKEQLKAKYEGELDREYESIRTNV